MEEVSALFSAFPAPAIVPWKQEAVLRHSRIAYIRGLTSCFASQIYGLDQESERLRPPPYTDGTPNESVQDVFVRVRQMMSIIETQYSGQAIVVVSPDSDNLSILQAALLGMDLKRYVPQSDILLISTRCCVGHCQSWVHLLLVLLVLVKGFSALCSV